MRIDIEQLVARTDLHVCHQVGSLQPRASNALLDLPICDTDLVKDIAVFCQRGMPNSLFLDEAPVRAVWNETASIGLAVVTAATLLRIISAYRHEPHRSEPRGIVHSCQRQAHRMG